MILAAFHRAVPSIFDWELACYVGFNVSFLKHDKIAPEINAHPTISSFFICDSTMTLPARPGGNKGCQRSSIKSFTLLQYRRTPYEHWNIAEFLLIRYFWGKRIFVIKIFRHIRLSFKGNSPKKCLEIIHNVSGKLDSYQNKFYSIRMFIHRFSLTVDYLDYIL